MVPEMYGDDLDGDDLDGDDDSLGFEYTEILGDEIPGHTTSFGDDLDGDDLEGAFVGDFVGLSRGAKVGIAAAAAAAGLSVAAYLALKKRSANKKRAAASALMRKRISAGALLRGVPPQIGRASWRERV